MNSSQVFAFDPMFNNQVRTLIEEQSTPLVVKERMVLPPSADVREVSCVLLESLRELAQGEENAFSDLMERYDCHPSPWETNDTGRRQLWLYSH